MGEVYHVHRDVVAGHLGAVAHGALQCPQPATVPLLRAWFVRPHDNTKELSTAQAERADMIVIGDAVPPPMARAHLAAVLEATPAPRPRFFVDLYCGGAGGVSQAAVELGLVVVLGVDSDADHLGCWLAQHQEASGALYEFGSESASVSAAFVEQRLAELGVALDDAVVHVSPSCKGVSEANTLAKGVPMSERLEGSRHALDMVRCLRRRAA